jgi:SagB-type dehydrogenase family enzyme
MGRLTMVLVPLLAVLVVGYGLHAWAQEVKPAEAPTTIALPAPQVTTAVTVEQAIQQRRSVRRFAAAPVTLVQVSQLLWAAQGITDPASGHRTAPSAMATYPLRVYLFAGNVTDLPAGVYRYVPQGHKLELVVEADQRANAGGQPQMRTAPALLLFTADTTATAARAGQQMASSWAYIEAGHCAQNVLLEEIALGLVGVPMTGYDPAKVKDTLKLPDSEQPVYLIAAGQRG